MSPLSKPAAYSRRVPTEASLGVLRGINDLVDYAAVFGGFGCFWKREVS